MTAPGTAGHQATTGVPRCPRCRTPHDGHTGAGGALECAVCDHRWHPTKSGTSQIGTGVTSRTGIPPSVIPRPASRPPTEEYLPGDPQTEATRHGPLTERKDGRRSGRQVVVRPAAEAIVIDQKQSSDLFERLEIEARASRGDLVALPANPEAGRPGDLGTTAAAADAQKVSCPVCGVRFERQAGQRHNCPQCTTSFDEVSDRLEVGPGAGDRLIGATIHGCLIDRKLGEGGMGAVYHARQLSLDRSVAVKILPPDLARNRNFIQRFEREAKSLARINHPNILHIYDFGEDPVIGLYFMMIEYVEGLDLGEIINRKGQVSPLEMLDLLRQALTGLEAAADKGVIHRDIKPDNLMITDNGTVKVSDFGLAKGMIAQVGVTAAGVRVGTPAFMSPEQCDGADVDFRSDVYNLGATAYLCLTGRLPFDGETPFSIMLKHKTEIPSSMRTIDPTLDEEVDALILRMLAKKPDQRCQNLNELIHEVERLEVKLSGTDSILRKSRGPFRAMRTRVPINVHAEPPGPALDKPVDLPVLQGVPAKAPALEALPEFAGPTPQEIRPAGGSPAGDEGWKKLVADLIPLPPIQPAASPTPVEAPSPEHPLPEMRRESSSRIQIPGGNTSPVTPMPVTTDLAKNRSSGRLTSGRGETQRPNRKMEAELAQARERTRQAEAEALVTAGDRLAGEGAWREAIRQWQAAAEILAPGSIRRAEVMDQIHLAERTLASRRTVRRIIFTAGITAGLVFATFLGTPHLHNWLADQNYRTLRDGLVALPNAQARSVALKEFAAGEGVPWKWYGTVFGLTYRVEAGERAAAQALREAEKPRPPKADPVPQIRPVPVAIPPDSTWEEVLRLAAQARANGSLNSALVNLEQMAKTELHQQEEHLKAILRTRSTGDHGAVLEQTQAFRTRHTRAAPGTLARLPVAARVQVKISAAPVPGDLKLLVDGVPALLPRVTQDANDLPLLDLPISRLGGRETSLVAQAGGWTFDQATLAPEAGPDAVTLVLRPLPAWHLPETRSDWATITSLGSTLAVLRADSLSAVRALDGGEVARYQPGGRTLTPLLRLLAGGRVLSGTDDGLIQMLSPTLVPEQVYHRGRAVVATLAEFELTYQTGKKVRLVVEDAPGKRTLTAWDGVRELWSTTPLQSGLVPFLMHVDDRILVVDAQFARFLEEDGKAIRDVGLPAPRCGPVLALSGRRELISPTGGGNQRLLLGDRAEPLRLIADPLLTSLGKGLVAADADILVHGDEGGLTLLRPGAPGRPSTLLWKDGNVRRPGGDPILTPRLVITTESQGCVSVRRRSDGQLVWRMLPVVAPAVPPVVVDLGGRTGLVMLDRQGALTAYPLP